MEQAKCIPCVAISLKYNITYIIARLPSTEPRASHSTYVKSGKKKKKQKKNRALFNGWPGWYAAYAICALYLSFSFFFGRTSRIKNIFISKACQVKEIYNRQSLKEFSEFFYFHLQPAAHLVCWLLLLPVPVIIFRLPVPPRRALRFACRPSSETQGQLAVAGKSLNGRGKIRAKKSRTLRRSRSSLRF